jgi:hypothetical protein
MHSGGRCCVTQNLRCDMGYTPTRENTAMRLGHNGFRYVQVNVPSLFKGQAEKGQFKDRYGYIGPETFGQATNNEGSHAIHVH